MFVCMYLLMSSSYLSLYFLCNCYTKVKRMMEMNLLKNNRGKKVNERQFIGAILMLRVSNYESRYMTKTN